MEKTKGLTFPQLVEEAFLLFHKLFRDKLLQVRLKFLLRGGMMHALIDMNGCLCVSRPHRHTCARDTPQTNS